MLRKPFIPGAELHKEMFSILNYGGAEPYKESELMEIFGVSMSEVMAELRKNKKILGLSAGEGDVLYPRWQFIADGKLLPGLEEVLKVVPCDDPWGVADVLTSPQGTLGYLTPIAAIREKKFNAIQLVKDLFRRVYDI